MKDFLTESFGGGPDKSALGNSITTWKITQKKSKKFLFAAIAVIGGLFAALHYPVVFCVLFLLFLLGAIWLLPRLWRGICALAAKIRAIFKSTEQPPPLHDSPLPPEPLTDAHETEKKA